MFAPEFAWLQNCSNSASCAATQTLLRFTAVDGATGVPAMNRATATGAEGQQPLHTEAVVD